MSRSGVPVVSNIARVASGENVFKEFKASVAQTASLPLGTVDRLTKGAIGKAGIPLLSEQARTASEVYQNPYSKGAQGRYLQSSIKTAAVIAGGVYGGPIIASQTGLGAGASSAVAGKVTYDLSKGDVAGALNTGFSAMGPISTPFGEISPDQLVSKFTKSVGTLPRSPVETFNQPSQTLVYPQQKSAVSNVLIFAGIAGVTFLLIKMRKK